MTTGCFDFDGVLASYDGWKDGEIGEPIPAGVELIRLCREAGHKIIIATCRTHPKHGTSHVQQLKIICWLTVNRVSFDWLETEGKPVADYYVDDRGLWFNQEKGYDTKYADELFSIIKQRAS